MIEQNKATIPNWITTILVAGVTGIISYSSGIMVNRNKINILENKFDMSLERIYDKFDNVDRRMDPLEVAKDLNGMDIVEIRQYIKYLLEKSRQPVTCPTIIK